MLKYLVIQLDDTSVSFCHYDNGKTEKHLIALKTLNNAIFWSMKENLAIQFLYPNYELPTEYKRVISSIDHANIVASACEDADLRENADVVVFDSWHSFEDYAFSTSQAYVIRTMLDDLFSNKSSLIAIIQKVSRLNVVVTDLANFNQDAESKYTQLLDDLTEIVSHEYQRNHGVQVNIQTDRMMLVAMNNCGAGDETITLAPDGKFYICPGFYLDGKSNVGDVVTGLDIKNPQLYKLEYAPICRICDAYQCRRCIWLNKQTTLEVNTPSHEQCIMAHIERNASRKLLAKIREIGTFLPDKDIPEIAYLDPFDEVVKHK